MGDLANLSQILDIYFINLELRIDRKVALLENLKKYNSANLAVHRVNAINGFEIDTQQILGSISPGEKACFLSHQKAIEASNQSNNYSLILEDDVQFSKKTINILDQLIGLFDDSVDIVFTEIGVVDAQSMVDFFVMRTLLLKNERFQLLDLKNINFWGATSYLVSPKSKIKLLALLNQLEEINSPFDEQLKQWINAGKLNAKYILPFPITLASNAFKSDIRIINSADIAHHHLRRMMGIEADLTNPNEDELDKIYHSLCYPQLEKFSKIMAIQISSALLAHEAQQTI